jgi:hypothetical protein
VCARCLGLYLGAIAGGAGALLMAGHQGRAYPAVRARSAIAAASVPILLTLAGEWMLRLPVGNVMRFAAALPLGATAAWLVTRALEVDWRA